METAATERRVEHLRSVETMLAVECRCLKEETLRALALDLLDNRERVWHRLDDGTPLPSAGLSVIFGRDCLGFVHNATHLLGSRDIEKSWIEEWTQILI
jgi:hypothetical protein